MFNDHFSVAELPSEIFKEGAAFEATYKNVPIGIVIIMAMAQFKFSKMTNTFSLIMCGHPPSYMATILVRKNHNQPLAPEAPVYHIVFAWHQRYRVQNDLILDWWKNRMVVEHVDEAGEDQQ